MAITAALVKELRERTGAGMMECKKALVAANGDMDLAIEEMRKSGLTKADKKASRVAADGLVKIASNGDAAVALEVNCETDFVAKGDDFIAFVDAIAAAILNNKPADLEGLNGLDIGNGITVDQRRRELIAKIGENMSVRRFTIIEANGGQLGTYSHGGRIGVVASIAGGTDELAKDIAMHVAASNPQYLKVDDIPEDVMAKEREIQEAQAADSGKPAEIISKMVAGRLRKQFGEVSLLSQPFVKDPDQTIEKLVKASNATVNTFARYEVGEGIEKEEVNFADEVMAQAKAI